MRLSPESRSFNYGLVDGVGRARERAIEPKLDGQVFRAISVGPIIELNNLVKGEPVPELRASRWFEEGSLEPLLKALTSQRTQWLAGNGHQGLLRGEDLEQEDRLASFKIDAHKAALGARFGKAAPLLVAALGELVGNVIDHSEAQATGLAIFSASPGVLEIVVADNGIGVLKSLTKNPEHAHLRDEGAALAAMVETGVSRFERGIGHGNGFRPIFEKLADVTGELRFRSGEYALSLDGRFGDRIGRQLAQKPRLSGFLAAITCRAPAASS